MEALIEQLTLPRVVFALATSSFLSIRGLRKKSLSIDGAIAAFITGMIHCIAGYDFTLILAVFFLSSSMWTKYKSEIKRDLEEDFKEGARKGPCKARTARRHQILTDAPFFLQVDNATFGRCCVTVLLHPSFVSLTSLISV